jgi:hypothetical protein
MLKESKKYEFLPLWGANIPKVGLFVEKSPTFLCF